MASSSIAQVDRFEPLVLDGVRAVFQPIVALATGAQVGFEALARGPVGSAIESPDRLFSAAQAAGRLPELEIACQQRAVDAALEAGLREPSNLFVNVEPLVLASGRADELRRTWGRARRSCRVVVELTERALTAAPAELLAQVDLLRAEGFLIAIDDVGADSRSLALLSFVRPDVIKLDIGIIQRRPSSDIAEVVHAVAAERERTGAAVVAEGIETDDHLETAIAFGATHGQGWRFGRPAGLQPPECPVEETLRANRLTSEAAGTPLALVSRQLPLRRARKRLLLGIARQLEQHAGVLGPHGVILATFESAKYFGPVVAKRYAALAAESSFVGAFATDLATKPAGRVRGQSLTEDEPLRSEWDVCVVAPHFAAVLASRDLESGGDDLDRLFEYAVSYDRDLAVAAARTLMRRVTPVGA